MKFKCMPLGLFVSSISCRRAGHEPGLKDAHCFLRDVSSAIMQCNGNTAAGSAPAAIALI
jgi:hypothetical protein